LKIQNGLFLLSENIGNLLQERNLIRSTRQEYTANADPKAPNYAFIICRSLLEGGIISYDLILLGGLEPDILGQGLLYTDRTE
jgi:curli production assembly/transport component CsgG